MSSHDWKLILINSLYGLQKERKEKYLFSQWGMWSFSWMKDGGRAGGAFVSHRRLAPVETIIHLFSFSQHTTPIKVVNSPWGFSIKNDGKWPDTKKEKKKKMEFIPQGIDDNKSSLPYQFNSNKSKASGRSMRSKSGVPDSSELNNNNTRIESTISSSLFFLLI